MQHFYTLALVALMALTSYAPATLASESQPADSWDVANPPGTWQPVTIDTDRTTWSNVDVSPDGSTIVFDALGDIFSLPITGGTATALTTGIAWNYQPRFSPDGKAIAFVSDRAGGDNLWVMNADGTNPRAITNETADLVHNPNWSPDGRFLVGKKSFMSTRSIAAGEIWLFAASHEGAGLQLTERPLGERDQKNQAEPAFSADGRYVFFSRDVTPGDVWQYGKDATGEIFAIERYDLDTGKIIPFVTGAGGAIRPTPSPDGKYLAFVKRLPGLHSAIYLKDLTSGKEWAVYENFERDLQETSGTEGNAPAFAWTPDSAALIFWSAGQLHRLDIATRGVANIPVRVRKTMRVRSTVRHAVDVAPDSFRVKMPRWPVVSPDGKTVVFQALGVLWAKALPDGQPRRLTRQSDHFEMYPAFSPDGRAIVYTTWDDEAQGSVRTVAVRGGRSRVLTPQPGNFLEPAYSADGKTVAYRQIGGGYLLSGLWSMEPGIYTVPAAGGTPVKVLESGVTPRFSPDSKRLFVLDAGEKSGYVLRSVNLAGNDPRTHLTGEKMTELVVSPDARWVAFIEDYRAYVAPLALTGKPVALSLDSKSLPLRRLSGRAGDFLAWQNNDAMTFSRGATLFTRQIADAVAIDGEAADSPDTGIDLGFDLPADRPDGTVALVGARIVTMRDALNGVQEVIDDGTIVVRGNRIVAIGGSDEVTVPDGADRIDASGKTIVPGLLDAHAHGGFGRAQIIPEQNWMQFSNLAFGVTTIHDPSNDTFEVFAASELQKAGKIVAPRIFSTGTILYGAKGNGYHVDIDSLDDARFHIQRMKDVGAISVKSYQLPRRDARQQLVAAADELGIMVVVEGGMKFQHNLTEIVDGHTTIEHSVTVKTVYDDVLQLWPRTGSAYTPTLVVAFGGMEGERYFYDRDNVWENERLMRYTPRSRVEPRAIRRQTAPDNHYNHFFTAASAHALMQRGVAVNTGAHGQREGLAIHWEMRMLVQGGFTPWEALRAATASGAYSLGMNADIGSLEPGKLADLVIIDGNPLAHIEQAEQVHATMINGRLFEAASMNQTWPEARARAPFFWEREGGDTIHPSTSSWLRMRHQRFGCPH